MRDAIGVGRGALGLIVVPAECVWVAKGAGHWLRHIWNNLHTTRHRARRTPASSRVSGSCRPPKSFRQLFHERCTHVEHRDMHGVCHAQHHQRALSGERQAGFRCIQTRARRLLDFADPYPSLPNNRSNKNVGDEQAQRIGL